MRADQCASAVKSVEVPVFVCLRIRPTCNQVNEVGGPRGFVRFELQFVKQNDGEFVDVIPR